MVTDVGSGELLNVAVYPVEERAEGVERTLAKGGSRDKRKAEEKISWVTAGKSDEIGRDKAGEKRGFVKRACQRLLGTAEVLRVVQRKSADVVVSHTTAASKCTRIHDALSAPARARAFYIFLLPAC